MIKQLIKKEKKLEKKTSGERLKELRLDLGMTHKSLADYVMDTKVTAEDIESYEKNSLDIEWLDKLVKKINNDEKLKKFGIEPKETIEWLLKGS